MGPVCMPRRPGPPLRTNPSPDVSGRPVCNHKHSLSFDGTVGPLPPASPLTSTSPGPRFQDEDTPVPPPPSVVSGCLPLNSEPFRQLPQGFRVDFRGVKWVEKLVGCVYDTRSQTLPVTDFSTRPLAGGESRQTTPSTHLVVPTLSTVSVPCLERFWDGSVRRPSSYVDVGVPAPRVTTDRRPSDPSDSLPVFYCGPVRKTPSEIHDKTLQ